MLFNGLKGEILIFLFSTVLAGCGGGGERRDAIQDDGIWQDHLDIYEFNTNEDLTVEAGDDNLAEGGVEGVDVAEPDEDEVGDKLLAFCESYIESICSYINNCCREEEKEILRTKVDCDDYSSGELFARCYDERIAYIEDGSARVDESMIDGCLGIFNQMTQECPQWNASGLVKNWYLEVGCGDVVRGSLDPGQECESDEQCARSYFCSGGLCEPRKGIGEECVDARQCIAGHVCINGVCDSPHGVGETCDDDGDCNVGLYCNISAGICSSMFGEGVECDPDSDKCAGYCNASIEPPVCSPLCGGS